MFRIQSNQLDEPENRYVVTGFLDSEVVRFAISRDARDRLGWNPCMEEAFRRLELGDRDFSVS